MDRPFPLHVDRTRAAWWSVLAALGVAFVLFVSAFAGTFVLGLFVYYGVRPLHRLVRTRLDSRSLSASLTLLLVVLPALGLVGYAGLVAFQEFAVVAGPRVTQAVLARLPGDPRSLEVAMRSPSDLLARFESVPLVRGFVLTGLDALGRAANGLLHLTLALAFSFFLLRDSPRLVDWFYDDIAHEGGVADAYLTAVDADLETVYFGNVLTVVMVGVAALVGYHAFNSLSPSALRVPFPTLLALLTGLATFVPLVVGKLVYLPTAGYLAWSASRVGAGIELLPWIGAFLVGAFLVLDLVPQTFVRPYLSGQSLHSGLVLFAYVLGAALFGWYGLFLGPLLLVLVIQAANVVLPELLHGDRLTPMTHTSTGSEPRDRGPSASDASESTPADDPTGEAGGSAGGPNDA